MKFIKKGRILSLILAGIFALGATPLTVFTAFADNSSQTTQAGAAQTVVTNDISLGEQIEREMASRKAITKDRSGIKSSSEVAVYVNGEIKHEGKFRDMWYKAIDIAPISVVDRYVQYKSDFRVLSDKKLAELDEVEFVLNKDIKFDYKIAELFDHYYDVGGLYVQSRKLTIDLNGHLLHRSDFDDVAWSGHVISAEDGSVLTIMDSNPTAEHRGKLNGHLWIPDDKGDVILKGGIMSGGHLRLNPGGGIFTDFAARVIMKGGTIAGNRAANGAGVSLGERCVLDMSEGTSQICYNDSRGSHLDGGAIEIRKKNVSIKGGYVHHNYADDYGAGIRVAIDTYGSTVDGTVIYANKAAEEGGGVYAEASYREPTEFKNCRIINNYSGERGGGVYVYQSNFIMNNCHVEGNCSQEHGGGICVYDNSNYDLTIGGDMIVRKNYKSSYKNMEKATDNSNLYIQGDSNLAVNDINYGSEIWVRTGTAAEKYNGYKKSITKSGTFASAGHFYSDNGDFYVAQQNDPVKKNYRRLYLEKGARPAQQSVQNLSDYTPVNLSKEYDYKVETGENKDKKFTLTKGYFEFNLMTSSNFSSASPFYYSDGYFFEDPKEYNKHLATMSVNMAVAAFGRGTKHVPGNNYANHFANVKQLMSDIGCEDENFFANAGYQSQPTFYAFEDMLSTIGVAISKKDVVFNNTKYTIVPIAIRGGSYEVEWASNVTIGNKGEAEGFADAADQVYAEVQNYVRDYGLEEGVEAGTVKFWVVGYSRAGATANLTSKRLVDAYGEKGNQVFGYTFEAPMGGIKEAKVNAAHTGGGTYPTIHNTVNENDFVTLVAPQEMGFIRYGVDHLIGAHHKGGDKIFNDDGDYIESGKYYKQRQKMITQLKAINPYYNFSDSWQVADINIILSRLPLIGTDLIDKGEQLWDDPNPECRNIYDFLRFFFLKVQEDGLDTGKDNFREYYSTHKVMSTIQPTTTEKIIKLMEDWGLPRWFIDKLKAEYSNPDKEKMLKSDLSVQESVSYLMNLMYTLPDDKMTALMDIVMDNVGRFMNENGILDLLDIYFLFANWTDKNVGDRQDSMYVFMKIVFGDSIANIEEVLGTEKADKFRQAISTVLYFGLNFASADYADTEDDDGMWVVGTFINNMDVITSNHYQEVTVAWVRSYDSYYDNEVESHKIQKTSTTKPTGSYSGDNNLLTLEAEEGSSIFYSLDGEKTWKLYTKPVHVSTTRKNIKVFSISRGVKSEVTEIYTNRWAGSLLGNGNIWFITICSAVIVVGGVVTMEVVRRKEKAKAKEQSSKEESEE